MEQTEFESDVLVIGGGMAGFFAALRAADKGQQVLLVDKGITGKSGFTPWANTFSVFDESLGDKKADWIRGAQLRGEYIVNLDYFNMQIEDSLARYKDLVNWGLINFKKEWNDKDQPARRYIIGQDRRLILPKILKERGIKIVQRVMVTNLLLNKGRVVGAMGFHMESDETLVFRTKATILCTGAGAYKAPAYPVHCSTFDGDAMAYRVGARISGKEFVDFHATGDIHPADVWTAWGNVFVDRIYETKGPSVTGRSIGIGSAFTVHAEAPPIPSIMPKYPMPAPPPPDPRGFGGSIIPNAPEGNNVMGAATGLGVHKSEGIWPADNKCSSGIPGLYAAGDALASMLCGSSYIGLGSSLSGSAVQGHRAGEYAAEYAAQAEKPRISADDIANIKEDIIAPLKRTRGFNPRWVSQVLLTTMTPYYVLFVKNKARLEGTLRNIEFIRDYMTPRLMAKDPHELRLAHETQNMVLNAEMKLRASLMRTESRGNHYRQDYPARSDKEWLSWILIKQNSKGKMTLKKEPMPNAWKGDLNLPYQERYPGRFPGELEYLGLG
jgi:succinate dehydrogenase/fumarate reductase flavoprotein subunit